MKYDYIYKYTDVYVCLCVMEEKAHVDRSAQDP